MRGAQPKWEIDQLDSVLLAFPRALCGVSPNATIRNKKKNEAHPAQYVHMIDERKSSEKVTAEPKPLPEDNEEQDLRLKAIGKRKRVVSKYKPSRHSR
jgi:hypothetical protein